MLHIWCLSLTSKNIYLKIFATLQVASKAATWAVMILQFASAAINKKA